VINGYGDRPCFHHYSPLPAAVAHPTKTMSYSEVLYEVQVLAGVLRHKLGVKKGDRVIIYVSPPPSREKVGEKRMGTDGTGEDRCL
jgi:acyl-coenzyme A synthetase/AMP-(fatty) acid ligase